jgi:hypothetical protein
MFDLVTLAPNIDRLTLGEAQLEPLSLQRKDNVTKFDLMCTFVYNPLAANNLMSCSVVCSQDMFNQSTVHTLVDRYSSLLRQLFNSVPMSGMLQPLYKFSIILPNELTLIHELNISDDSEQQKTKSTISQLFSQRAASQPQKVAVELDEQSLSYTELLYYVQRLALHLLANPYIAPGDIVCQCVERSLSMVS